MKSNAKLIAIAIGSLLVVGAFLAGILIGFPSSEHSTVRAQESTTPPPKPPPTGEDLDRWEREWAAKNYEGLLDIDVQVEEIPEVRGASGEFEASQPGDRVIKFRDGSQKVLTDDVEITETVYLGGLYSVGDPVYHEPTYFLKRGEDTLAVDSYGTPRPTGMETLDDHNPDAFPFLTQD